MSLSESEVNDYITSAKVLKSGSQLLYDKTKFSNTYDLVAASDKNTTFKLDYTESEKVSLRLSCHHRDMGNVGLIRIDYNGSGHRNPVRPKQKVVLPEFLKSYSDAVIPPRVAHIHIYVAGMDLDWAVPLNDYVNAAIASKHQINILSIEKEEDKIKAIENFIKIINLDATLNYREGLQLN